MDYSGIIAALRKTKLMSELSEEALQALARGMSTKRFSSGDVVCSEGTRDPFCYLVNEGKIRISKRQEDGRESILRDASPGEILGLTSVFFPQGRSASMTAMEDTETMVLPHEHLLSTMRHTNSAVADAVTQALFRELSRRIRTKNSRIARDAAGQSSDTTDVLVFDSKGYVEESFSRLPHPRLKFTHVGPRLSLETARLAEGYSVINIFVNDKVDAQTAEVLKENGVGLIALRAAGFNNVDLEACSRLGISVVRVPAYSPHAVAEHALALLMSVNRKIHRAHERVRLGDFRLDGLVGMDLHGKTMGVIGTGKIGQCFIQIALGLGCKVLAFDVKQNPEVAKLGNVKYVELSELFRSSDVISLHAPLTKETKHMLGKEAFDQMKEGVIIINTSRGALIDTPALIDGLKDGKIGGAGLDVYEEEEGFFFEDFSASVISDDVLARLLTFHNVVVTGHQAFLTTEALENIASVTINNINEYLDGKRGKELTNGLTGQ